MAGFEEDGAEPKAPGAGSRGEAASGTDPLDEPVPGAGSPGAAVPGTGLAEAAQRAVPAADPSGRAAPAADPHGTAPAADPQGDPYLRTRFAIPARPATFLRRERLLAHLDQALTTPLTMVNGSAGAGKTLLVADWAAEREPSVAWFTTEAADQGPGMFWAYLL
jgi:LuxR family maltose regulon positive regulatory protein